MNGFTPSCPCCGADLILPADQFDSLDHRYTVWFCQYCDFGQTLPAPDDATLHRLHSTQYYRNGEGIRFVSPIEWLVEGMCRWRVHRLSKAITKGRILDIGCGSGRFLRAMRDNGWEVAGVELNDDVAASSRTVHGLLVETSLERFAPESFDLITITHVIEHVRDPWQMLCDCGHLLKPGGVISVAIPNITGWQARLSKRNWFHLDLPRHLWHFSEKWLSTTLIGLGFKQISVRRLDMAHNIFGWLQSLLNLLGLRHNRLYRFLSSDDLFTDDRGYWGSLIVSLALAPLFFLVAVALAVMEAACKASGTVEIVARKIDKGNP